MWNWWKRAVIALVSLAGAVSGALNARAYTIDDMLNGEELGRVLVAPGGRWLVFERRVPYAQAARFNMATMPEIRDRLYVVDLKAPAAARPLVALEPGVATVAYGFSPSGRRIAIGRLAGDRWTLGVVTLATGTVRWFGLTPDYSPFKPTLAWLSDDTLVTVAEPQQTLPWVLRIDAQLATRMPALWDAQRAGHVPTVTAIGSGRFAQVTPRRSLLELVHVNVVNGETRRLAEGDYHTLVAASGGRYLAIVENGATNTVPTGRLVEAGMEPHRWLLRILDLKDERSWTPCPTCDLPYDPPRWSPDGRRLLMVAHRHGDDWKQGRAWMVDPRKRTASHLRLDDLQLEIGGLPTAYATIPVGWSGKRPVILARRGQDEPRWFALGEGAPKAVSPTVTTADLAIGAQDRAVAIGAHEAWTLGSTRPREILAHADSVQIVGDNGRNAAIGMRKARSSSVLEVAGFRGSFVFPPGAQGVAADADTGLVVARAPGADGSDALLVATGDRPPVEIARINTALAGVEKAVAIRLDYQLPGQGAASGWLYLPPDRSSERLPLVTIGYPGTVYGDTPPSPDGRGLGRNNYEVAALVGHGYAVLMPSMPTQATASDHGFQYATQLLQAVDAAIATGRIDPDRLGLWGHSFGGYMVATVLTQTDRFKAAIAANGPYDLLPFIGSFTPWTRLDPEQGQSILSWAGWAETGQPQLRATAWADPQRYLANSPVYRADRIHTPLLIVGGERDTVSIQQSEELFSALYRQGKDAELLTYWGEDHAPLSPANVRDLFARAFAWFDRHFEQRTSSGRSSGGAEGRVDALLPAPRPTLDQ